MSKLFRNSAKWVQECRSDTTQITHISQTLSENKILDIDLMLGERTALTLYSQQIWALARGV